MELHQTKSTQQQRLLNIVIAMCGLVVAHSACGEEKRPSPRSKDQLEYFVPMPLKYSSQELIEIQRAATQRNIAVLNDHAAQAIDRTAYTQERQAIMAIDVERRKWAFRHEQATFARQTFFSEIVFWISNLIVLSGLLLTIRQFTRDEMGWKTIYRHNQRLLRRTSSNLANPPPGKLLEAELPETKISLKSDGIEIGTRVTGLAILVISLGFYYLMLTYVYKITTVDTPQPSAGNSTNVPTWPISSASTSTAASAK